VDLARDRLLRARERHPAFALAEATAASLPFGDAAFDLVLQFTLFTSVLDSESRRRIGSEVLRVLRPGGMIVWYDFWPNNPWNPNVQGIRPPEIRALFPGCTYDFKGLTLLPPIARWLAPRSWFLADLLSRMPFLTCSYLAVVEKPHA
jgi:SAM-dependent methyltransferase